MTLADFVNSENDLITFLYVMQINQVDSGFVHVRDGRAMFTSVKPYTKELVAVTRAEVLDFLREVLNS